jgi:hypothetical protein
LDSITNKPVWKNISGDLPPGLPVNMLAVDPANPDAVFFAGTDFGLYYTIDSGKTWHKDYRMPNVAVHEVKMREDRTLFAFTHGRGMFALPLKAAKVGVRDVGRDGRLQAKIYPNPSSDFVQVIAAQSLVGYQYSVMDLQGKVLLSGSFDEDEAISTRTLKNGNYFLRVSGAAAAAGASANAATPTNAPVRNAGTVVGRTFTTKFIVQH